MKKKILALVLLLSNIVTLNSCSNQTSNISSSQSSQIIDNSITITYNFNDLDKVEKREYEKGSVIDEFPSISNNSLGQQFVNFYKTKEAANSLDSTKIFYLGSIVNADIEVYAGYQDVNEVTSTWNEQVIKDITTESTTFLNYNKQIGLKRYLGTAYVENGVPFFYSSSYSHEIYDDGFVIYGNNLGTSMLKKYIKTLSSNNFRVKKKSDNLYIGTSTIYSYSIETGVIQNNDKFYVKVCLKDSEYAASNKLPIDIIGLDTKYISVSKLASFDGVQGDVTYTRNVTTSGRLINYITYTPNDKVVDEEDTSNGVNYLANYLDEKIGLNMYNMTSNSVVVGKVGLDTLSTFRIEISYDSDTNKISLYAYSLLDNEISYQYFSRNLSTTYFGGTLEDIPTYEDKIYDVSLYNVVTSSLSLNGIGIKYLLYNLDSTDLSNYTIQLLKQGFHLAEMSTTYAYLYSPNYKSSLYLYYYDPVTFTRSYSNYININKGVISADIGQGINVTKFPMEEVNNFFKANTKEETIPEIPSLDGGKDYYYGNYKTTSSTTGSTSLTSYIYQIQIEVDEDVTASYADRLKEYNWTVSYSESSSMYTCVSLDNHFSLLMKYSTNTTYKRNFVVMVISYKSSHTGLTTYDEVQSIVNYRLGSTPTLPEIAGVQDQSKYEVTEYNDGTYDRVLIHITYSQTTSDDGTKISASENGNIAKSNFDKAFESNEVGEWKYYGANYDSSGNISQKFYINNNGVIMYYYQSFAHLYIGYYK